MTKKPKPKAKRKAGPKAQGPRTTSASRKRAAKAISEASLMLVAEVAAAVLDAADAIQQAAPDVRLALVRAFAGGGNKFVAQMVADQPLAVVEAGSRLPGGDQAVDWFLEEVSRWRSSPSYGLRMGARRVLATLVMDALRERGVALTDGAGGVRLTESGDCATASAGGPTPDVGSAPGGAST